MIKQGTNKVKFMKGTSKVKALMLGTQKVWSSGSVVSYYDGDTLLGTEEVEEGLDVLHPSISTAKTGYTLYGWGLSNSIDAKIGQLVATGEPMKLYALYLPNALTVAQGRFTSESMWADYVVDILNADYVTGHINASAQGYNSWGGGQSQPKEDTQTFTIDLGLYGKATISGRFVVARGDGAQARFDNTSVSSSFSKNVTASGSHTLWAFAYAPSGLWASAILGVTSIVLSEPTAWV